MRGLDGLGPPLPDTTFDRDTQFENTRMENKRAVFAHIATCAAILHFLYSTCSLYIGLNLDLRAARV